MPEGRYQNSRELCQRAHDLRRQPVRAETMLWNLLRSSRDKSIPRFRRQHPISPYIVDFACIKARLIIELDGYSHDMRQDYDAARDRYLLKNGWFIMRFGNEEIYNDAEGIALMIITKARELLAHPGPPASGREI